MKREPERTKRRAGQDERPQYSPPQALRLGQVAGGLGYCFAPGSGDGTQCNVLGNSALTCDLTGNSAG